MSAVCFNIERLVHDDMITPNLPTNIVVFKGSDSSILTSRDEISRPIGNFSESLNQAMLVGVMLVGRLGVLACANKTTKHAWPAQRAAAADATSLNPS